MIKGNKEKLPPQIKVKYCEFVFNYILTMIGALKKTSC